MPKIAKNDPHKLVLKIIIESKKNTLIPPKIK
jgi:hypothetical protein